MGALVFLTEYKGKRGLQATDVFLSQDPSRKPRIEKGAVMTKAEEGRLGRICTVGSSHKTGLFTRDDEKRAVESV